MVATVRSFSEEEATTIGEQTAWYKIHGLSVLVVREEHLQSVWWRVYVRGIRRANLHDYYLGDISTIKHETFKNERFYTKSEYHYAMQIHTSVHDGVMRLVSAFESAEVK